MMLALTGCATIVGGAKYNAKVLVPNHPQASIYYNDVYKGTGEATFKVNRRDADRIRITVQEDGCEPMTQTYTHRTFRGWSFVGTALTWTGYLKANGKMVMLLPWGVVTDWITGAWWKPDVSEKGVEKEDFDNFTYTLWYEPKPLKEKANDHVESNE